MARRVILPYSVLALVLIAFGFYVRRSPLPDIVGKARAASGEDGRKSFLSYP